MQGYYIARASNALQGDVETGAGGAFRQGAALGPGGRKLIDIERLLIWALGQADDAGGGAVAAVDDPAGRDGAMPLAQAALRRAAPGYDRDAEVVCRAVRRLGGEAARLVVQHGRAASRPDWQGEPYELWRRRAPVLRSDREAGALARRVATCDKGRVWQRSGVVLRQDRVCLLDTAQARAAWAGVPACLPVEAAWQGERRARAVLDGNDKVVGHEIVYVDRGRELQQAKARYRLWHGALAALASALTVPPALLSRWWPRGPAAPPEPWA